MNYKVIKNAKEIEDLRRDSFNIKFDNRNFYEQQINNGKILPLGGYINDELVVGAYISASFQSLYIDQLFVKKEYQHNGYGTNILQFILNNKYIFEDFFKTEFEFSKAEIRNENALKLVQNLGYKQTNDIYGTVRKSI